MDKAPAPSGAIEFHYELQRCDDIECCAALFRKQALAYGFDTYACGEVDVDERERNIFFIVGVLVPSAGESFIYPPGLSSAIR